MHDSPHPSFSEISYLNLQQTMLPFCKCTTVTLHMPVPLVCRSKRIYLKSGCRSNTTDIA
ncbi:hypothetical protein HanRHA438_Chr15g0731301 [Helianthus annuus]|nr:hypothetical protein HanIR_Chr15g0782481 [Helianthus annuus]KAJ0847003.1 hypothetical protein HanRHA438_Chr15g0731301 [Helianthus annuus]